MNPYTITFNDIVLNDLSGVDLFNHDFNQLPEFNVLQYKLARANKSIITAKEAIERKIPVQLDVCVGTRAETEAALVLLKIAILDINGTLVVQKAGEQVRYTATCSEMNIEWLGTRAIVTLIFTASDPYGYQSDQEDFTIPTITDASNVFVVPGAPTLLIQPQITLVFTSVTGGTSKEVSIRNASTQQGITIAGTFVTGDTLYIDSQLMVVYLNGVVVDFTGVFPIWSPTVQGVSVDDIEVEYTDSFTDRTVDGTFNYTARL